MNYILVLLFTLVITYAVSRVLMRVRLFPANDVGLRVAHAASAIAVVLVVAGLKFPAGGFAPLAVLYISLAQLAWYFLDRFRKRWPQAAKP